jgi:hypothetical protein
MFCHFTLSSQLSLRVLARADPMVAIHPEQRVDRDRPNDIMGKRSEAKTKAEAIFDIPKSQHLCHEGPIKGRFARAKK